MKDEDLEKTISIETLDELKDPVVTREERNKEEATTREAKYEAQGEVETLSEAGEEAEEALAEKNIAQAEEILANEEVPSANEPETTVTEVSDEDKEDEQLKKKIKKILIIVGIVAAVAILVLVLILVFTGKGKDDKKSSNGGTATQNKKEEAPVIVDNYYYKDGTLHLLDSTDKVIGEYECLNKDEKLCFVAYNENADNFDIDANLNEKNDPKKQRLSIYNDDYVFIFDNKNQTSKSIVLYSLKEKVTKETYLDVKAFSDGYVIVEDSSNKYGLIQIKDGKISEIIKPSYEGLGMIDGENNLVAKKGNDYIIISKDNKALSATISGANTIKKYNDKLIVTQNGKDYSVYSYKGELIVGGYSFATIADKYIGLVSNKKLYVRDIDNNKYNEAPIELKNSYYVHRNIYNDDNKLDYILASFSLNVKNNEIEVVVYEKEMKDGEYKHLEFNVVAVNKNYNYMNYFNKVLYFYSDETKEKLIGSYTCANENVFDDSNLLKNCLPANDTVYEDNEITKKESRNSTIPIINSRFVFIADGSNTVNLYDLVDKKVLGKYTSVNTYTASNDNKLAHYNGKMNIVALNKNGSYGMINIDGSNATPVYSFKYNKMEKIGNYFLAEDKDNKWLILYSSTSTSSLYPGKIVNFTKDRKYFKILKDNKYYVYDANAKNVSADTFSEVILYDNYFLGVTSASDLYLYNYSGNKITKEAIKPSSSCSLDDKYKVSYKDNVYKISVCNGDKYDEHTYDKTTESLDDDTKEDKKDDTKTEDKKDDTTEDKKDDDKKES